MRRLLLAAVLAALCFVPTAGAWTWPARGDVVQPFSFDPAHPYAAGYHRGIDIADVLGATVVAPATGAVTFAGTVPSSGKSITITTPDGYAVTLTHLGALLVGAGAAVSEGDPVATIGPSGDPEATVPYVHLGIRIAADEQGYVDPIGLLPARSAAPAVPPPAPAPAAVPPAVAPPAEADLPGASPAASPSATPAAATDGDSVGPATATPAAAAPAAAPVVLPTRALPRPARPVVPARPRPAPAAAPVAPSHAARTLHGRVATTPPDRAPIQVAATGSRPVHADAVAAARRARTLPGTAAPSPRSRAAAACRAAVGRRRSCPSRPSRLAARVVARSARAGHGGCAPCSAHGAARRATAGKPGVAGASPEGETLSRSRDRRARRGRPVCGRPAGGLDGDRAAHPWARKTRSYDCRQCRMGSRRGRRCWSRRRGRMRRGTVTLATWRDSAFRPTRSRATTASRGTTSSWSAGRTSTVRR